MCWQIIWNHQIIGHKNNRKVLAFLPRHCAMSIAHYALSIVHCALFIVRCTLSIIHCASYHLAIDNTLTFHGGKDNTIFPNCQIIRKEMLEYAKNKSQSYERTNEAESMV